MVETGMTEDFDRSYETTDALFGCDPERIVCAHVDLLPASGDVLDIGCGQGRNALCLARRGRPVVAVDPSEVAVDTVARAATAEGLPVSTVRSGFAELTDPETPFAGVVVVGLIQMLPPQEVDRLVASIRRWTTAGSVLFLVAWTTEDPRYREIAATWSPLGRGSYRAGDGRVRTFLPPGAAIELFPGWEVVEHVEGLGEWHHHGDDPAERHGFVELVARRR